MTPPSGLGAWVAYKPAAVETTLVGCGFSWVAPRAGFNGWNDPGCSAGQLIAYRRAGLRVYPWIYPTPLGVSAAVEGFRRLHQLGICDGLIVDAEAEWCADGMGVVAASFVAQLRAACPDAWIAHAPMDYVANHPLFPWAEFGALDAVLPQVYAFEHNDQGHAHHLDATDHQWRSFEASHPSAAPPRSPVGCTYRPPSRGGHPLPPWPDQGARVAADVAAFLDHPIVRASRAPSLYSIEAAPPEVLALLRARSIAATSDTEPPPQTLPSPQLRPDDWAPQTSATTATDGLVPEAPEDT